MTPADAPAPHSEWDDTTWPHPLEKTKMPERTVKLSDDFEPVRAAFRALYTYRNSDWWVQGVLEVTVAFANYYKAHPSADES